MSLVGMTNKQRREGLNRARTQALHFANLAQEHLPEGSETSWEYREMAKTWAAVADALKVGDRYGDETLTSADTR